MMKTKLARAITMTLAGGALSLGAVSTASATSTTMYNMSSGVNGTVDLTNNTTDPTTGGVWTGSFVGVTDGWTNGGSKTTGVGTIVPNQNWIVGKNISNNNIVTTANPFGYTGAHLNWALEMTGHAGNTATISTLDSFARYGAYADIDTAKGAWSDAAFGNAQGWRHDLDVGLFRTDHTGTVTLDVSGIVQSGTNFGFTIFHGMDAATDWNHHGGWNANNNTAGLMSPYGGVQAGTGLTTSDIVAYSVGAIGATPASNLNQITFNAVAGEVYTIFLGGYRNGAWGATNDGYALTVSEVPVPAAAWLFGGALMSLFGANRRKRVLPA